MRTDMKVGLVTLRRRTCVLVATVLVAAGCGDDDGAGSAGSATDTGTSAEEVATTAPGETTTPPETMTSPETTASAETGAGDVATTAEDVAATRIVDTPNGPIEVPVDLERITVIDEYAGMNLLALGVVPTVVYGSYQSVVGQQVLSDAGAEIRAMDGFALPNIEDVAATDPDLILFSTEGAFADAYEDLSAVAPTLELPYAVPWRDAIMATGEAVARVDEAERLIGLLEAEIDELAARVAAEPMSISILGDTLGAVFAVSMEAPLSHLLEEVGFTRPVAQAEGEPDTGFTSAIMISTEVLDEHDADRIVVMSGAFYAERTFLDAPTFQALPAVEDGRSVVADGDLWFGTFPFAIYWVLQDLAALHAGEDQDGIGTEADIAPRWAEFEALTGAG